MAPQIAHSSSIHPDNADVSVAQDGLFENLPVAVYTCDKNGVFTSFNTEAVELWGTAPVLGKDQFLGSWKMLKLNGEPLPVEETPMAISLRTGKSMSGERFLIERKDGSRVTVAPYPVPLYDTNGNLSGGMNTLINVTKIAEAEHKQALLAAIVNTSDDAIISKNLDGIISSWNVAAERMFGYTAKEAINRHISMLLPEERMEEENVIIDHIKRGLKVDHFETIRIAKDGTEIPISLTISPVTDARGKIVGASKIARSIKERLFSEEKQALLAAIVETSEDAIISKTLDGIISTWNSGAEKMFGYTADEAIGKHISILIPSDRNQEEILILSSIKNGMRVDHFETIRVHKSGKQIPISLSISPIMDSSGKIIGASKIARDISLQLQAQSESKRLYEQIKELNNKKDEFIGIASHELKTPLTSIYGYLQILDRLVNDETGVKFVNKTLIQVRKLTALVSDMLDVSKIEAGKLEFNPKPFEMKALIHEVIELLEQTFPNRSILCSFQSDDTMILADDRRIEQVLINLFTNALKYSPATGLVEVSVFLKEDNMVVSVKDQGAGIPADKLPHIFSKFYRADDASRVSGLGIGLYISHQIIERHHGQLWVENTGSTGSTFCFSLPV